MHTPPVCTPSFRTFSVKVLRILYDCFPRWMSFTFYRESIIDMAFPIQILKNHLPDSITFPAVKKGICITNQNQRISRSGKKNVNTLWGGHEPYVISFIAACERNKYNVALLSLVVI